MSEITYPHSLFYSQSVSVNIPAKRFTVGAHGQPWSGNYVKNTRFCGASIVHWRERPYWLHALCRVLYVQDMRLWRFDDSKRSESSIICNDDKLAGGSSLAYIRDASDFLTNHIFQAGGPWPSVIVNSGYYLDRKGTIGNTIEASGGVFSFFFVGDLIPDGVGPCFAGSARSGHVHRQAHAEGIP